MVIKGALKSKMAEAVLLGGMLCATPSYAQDQEGDTLTAGSQTTYDQQIKNETNWVWYDPQIPHEIFWGLFALTCAVSGASFYRKIPGTTLRSGAAAAVFAALANPQAIDEEKRVLPRVIPVFMDESASLGSRGSYVKETFSLLESQLSALGPVTLRQVSFGNDEMSASKPGTHLAQTMQMTLNTIPEDEMGAVFIVSDGIVADINNIAGKNINAPVHALIVGEEGEEDFYLDVISAPSIGIVGEEQNIEFSVVDGKSSDLHTATASVSIFYNGQKVRTNTIPVNDPQNIVLSEIYPDGLQLGPNLIDIHIEGIETGANRTPEEVSYENNRITIITEGISDRENWLLFTGEPGPGTRLWRNMLTSGASNRLLHFSYLRPLDKEDMTPLRDLATTVLPVVEVFEQKLSEQDVVIFDNYTFNGVIPASYFTHLNRYVEEGGSLIIVGADTLTSPASIAKTTLSEIMPLLPLEDALVYTNGFVPAVTEDGLRHRITGDIVESSPPETWGPWYMLAQTVARPEATVLLEDGAGTPLLAIQTVGKGRVAMLGSNQATVWAAGHKGGGPAVDLYENLAGWLIRNPKFDDENLRLVEKGGQIAVELRTMKDTVDPVRITKPSGETFDVLPELSTPGVYTFQFPVHEKGGYRAQRQGAEATEAYVVSGHEDEEEIKKVISTTAPFELLTSAHQGRTVRVITAEGGVLLPQIQNAGDVQEGDYATLAVNMQEKTETIGANDRPLLPYWLYGGLIAGCLVASFRQKEIAELSSRFVHTLSPRL